MNVFQGLIQFRKVLETPFRLQVLIKVSYQKKKTSGCSENCDLEPQKIYYIAVIDALTNNNRANYTRIINSLASHFVLLVSFNQCVGLTQPKLSKDYSKDWNLSLMISEREDSISFKLKWWFIWWRRRGLWWRWSFIAQGSKAPTEVVWAKD